MITIILSENRKLGVNWLKNNKPAGELIKDNQTRAVYANHDEFEVCYNPRALRGRRFANTDRAIIVGEVSPEMINTLNTCYGGVMPLLNGAPEFISSTQRKRAQLETQLRDLQREENLVDFFKAAKLDGVDFTAIDVSVSGRLFKITASGRFTN